jgi:hypothetical protein
MAGLKTDKAYRRKFFYLCGALVTGGFVIIRWGWPEFESFLKQQKPEDALHMLLIVLAALYLPVLLWVIFAFRFASRVMASAQFPPPGSRVLRDTEIIEGAPARRKGLIMMITSIILGLTVFFGAIYFPCKLSNFHTKKTQEFINTNDKPYALSATVCFRLHIVEGGVL